MAHDTADFLRSLFSGRAPDRFGDQAVDRSGDQAVDRSGQRALFPEPAEVADGDLMAEWVERPDAAGRIGLEPPDLAEANRSWAHPELLVEPGKPCPKCNGLEWWEDVAGKRHCLHCEGEAWQKWEALARHAALQRHRAEPAGNPTRHAARTRAFVLRPDPQPVEPNCPPESATAALTGPDRRRAGLRSGTKGYGGGS